MLDKLHRFPVFAVALVLGPGVAGFAMGAGQDESLAKPVRCEIRATAANGMIALEGVLHTEVEISGSYTFRVASAGGAGSSNVQQGGHFTADPDSPVTLGTVMLGNSGGTYNASLEVVSNGMTEACAERVGAI